MVSSRLKKTKDDLLKNFQGLGEQSFPNEKDRRRFEKLVSGRLGKMSPAELQALHTHFTTAHENLKQSAPSNAEAKKIVTLIQDVGDGPQGPASLGKNLAQAVYTHSVVLNPMNLGGQKVAPKNSVYTGTPEEQKKARKDFEHHRATESYQHYRHFSPAERQVAVDHLLAQRDSAPEGSRRKGEIESIIRGIRLTATMDGHDLKGLPRTSGRLHLIANAVRLQGREHDLLKTSEDLNSQEFRQAVTEAVRGLSDGSLIRYTKGDPYLSIYTDGLTEPKMGEEGKKALRKFVQDWSLAEMHLETSLGDAFDSAGVGGSGEDVAAAIQQSKAGLKFNHKAVVGQLARNSHSKSQATWITQSLLQHLLGSIFQQLRLNAIVGKHLKPVHVRH